MNGANDENKAPSDLQDSSIEQTLLVSSSVASLRPEVIE